MFSNLSESFYLGVALELLRFFNKGFLILGAASMLVSCLFHLPVEYKKGNKFQCFIYICVGLGAIALFGRVFA